MRILRNILTNPLAIAAAIVHWLVAVSVIAYEDNGLFDHTISFHRSDFFCQWLLTLNYPSFLIIEIIVLPIHLIFGKSVFTGDSAFIDCNSSYYLSMVAYRLYREPAL